MANRRGLRFSKNERGNNAETSFKRNCISDANSGSQPGNIGPQGNQHFISDAISGSQPGNIGSQIVFEQVPSIDLDNDFLRIQHDSSTDDTNKSDTVRVKRQRNVKNNDNSKNTFQYDFADNSDPDFNPYSCDSDSDKDFMPPKKKPKKKSI